MKKNLLKTFIVFLLLPALLLVGCKNDSLPKINLSRYLKNNMSVTRYVFTQPSEDEEESNSTSTITKTEAISLLTQKKAKKENLSKYIEFKLNAEPVWFYKMYVEYITFYIYCNESSDYQMIVNLSMTDLASEEDIFSTTNESVKTSTVDEQVSFKPVAKKAVKCTFKIEKTVINALGSTITIDIKNSPELYSGDGENDSTFMWLIYGFEIHGESRTYTR